MGKIFLQEKKKLWQSLLSILRQRCTELIQNSVSAGKNEPNRLLGEIENTSLNEDFRYMKISHICTAVER